MTRCTFILRDDSPFVGRKIKELEREYKVDIALYDSGDRSTILYAGKEITITGLWDNVSKCVHAEIKE